MRKTESNSLYTDGLYNIMIFSYIHSPQTLKTEFKHVRQADNIIYT